MNQVGSIQGGLLIIFDGIDGTGKTSQLQRARSLLEAEGWPVYTSRNLGGTPIGEELRRIMLSSMPRPETTNLYISVAIQEALIETIYAERAQGKIILMDRGPFAPAAYEIYGGQLDEDLVWKYVEDGMNRLRPELTIIYDTDVKTALARVQSKPGKTDYFESKPDDYFKRVANGYKEVAARYATNCTIIDAGQHIDTVHVHTMELIQKTLDAHSTH